MMHGFEALAKPLSVLVLGGGGFIGTNLCLALLESGFAVRAFGRRSFNEVDLKDVDLRHADFSDEISLFSALEGVDIVFHLLGGTTPSSSSLDPRADLIASTVPTIRLLDCCVEKGVKKIIFVSSGGTVYGVPQQTPILEDHPTNPISAYGISKLSIEKYLHLYEHLYGLEYLVLRLANPFGPYQNTSKGQGIIASIFEAALERKALKIWGDGSVIRDFIYISDVTSACLSAVAYQGTKRVFNIGTGIGRSISEVIESCREVLYPQDVEVVFSDARPTDVPVNVLDIGLAVGHLGWCPLADWKVALAETVAWMSSQKRKL